LKTATFFRRTKGRVNSATPEGGPIWQVYSAGQLGKFIQRVFWKRKSKAIEKKSKEWMYSVDL
jgi:hypothetical protein